MHLKEFLLLKKKGKGSMGIFLFSIVREEFPQKKEKTSNFTRVIKDVLMKLSVEHETKNK